ncbi:MAG: carboxypeptidase-like regulatory domain-containing protein [Armatimonadetes bacterium]|nr:carboxypeptidase-like regulatory domain-containing protein [Armatimonadota bacterium]
MHSFTRSLWTALMALGLLISGAHAAPVGDSPSMPPMGEAPAPPAPAKESPPPEPAKEAAPEKEAAPPKEAAPQPSPTSPPAATPDSSVDLKPGAIYGRVVDLAGKPVGDATVALMDKDGKVVAWTKTGSDGQYLLAVDSLKILRLQPSRQKGLLSRIAGGIGKVVTAPLRIADSALDTATGVARETVRSGAADLAKGAAASVVTGNPAPVASGVAQNVAKATRKQIQEKTKKQLQDKAARAVLNERQSTPKEKRKTLLPGEILIAVSAPNYKEVRSQAGTFWMEPAEEEKSLGPRAWLETVKLAPAASDRKSEVASEAILLTEPRMEPSMVPSGGTVNVSVKLKVPAGMTPNVRVFAREDRKKKVVELTRGEGNSYSGQLPLDPQTPHGPTTVTLVALRAEPVEVKLPKTKEEDPLLKFAAELDDLDPDRPYDYDPRIMASENRIDLPLTVLNPKLGTPTGPAPVKKQGE